MNILILGQTAGSHALAWKFAESRKTEELYCTSPFGGVDTLCTHVAEPTAQWRAAHAIDLVADAEGEELYRNEMDPPSGADHFVVDCLTDGRMIVPMPAVRLYADEAGECTAAEVPAGNFTDDLYHRVFHRFFVPQIRKYSAGSAACRGVVRFHLTVSDGEPTLLSVSRGFGEPDAVALLPTLRGELAGLLTACEDGSLSHDALRTNGMAVCALLLASEKDGAPIHGLADVVPTTGVFMGAVRYAEGEMRTAGRRALFVCGRGADLPSARRAALEAVGRIGFEGRIFRPPTFID